MKKKIKAWVVIAKDEPSTVIYIELKRKSAYQMADGLMIRKNEWRKYFKVIPVEIIINPNE